MGKASAEELMTMLRAEFPQVVEDYGVDALPEMGAVLRQYAHHKHLRPGGTVSGPSMFALADLAVYIAVMGMIGPQALTVTTSVSMDFMRKPVAGVDLIGRCELLKLGRLLAVGDVRLYSDGSEELVARATMTYAIPPARVSA